MKVHVDYLQLICRTCLSLQKYKYVNFTKETYILGSFFIKCKSVFYKQTYIKTHWEHLGYISNSLLISGMHKFRQCKFYDGFLCNNHFLYNFLGIQTRR